MRGYRYRVGCECQHRWQTPAEVLRAHGAHDVRVDLVFLPAGGGLDLGGVDCGEEDGEAVCCRHFIHSFQSTY